MKWNKFRLMTTTEAVDIVSSMLMDLGVQGIEIEDKIPLTEQDKEQMFVDILPDITVISGQRYWMRTLSRYSNRRASSIRRQPPPSARTFFPKVERSIR